MASSLPAKRETPQKINKNTKTPSPTPPDSIDGLANSIDRLTLDKAAATALPASSPSRRASSTRTSLSSQHNSPLEAKRPSRNFHRSPTAMSTYGSAHSPSAIMNRSPSSMSMYGSSPAPGLRKRTSIGSFHSATTPGSRRVSQASIATSPLASTSEDASGYTTRGIAQTHFASELKVHSDATVLRPTNTIVILHDSCYGHRYARPRTSKAALASIVERPERIQACVLGVSVAYVRLGGRHDEGCFPPHPKKEGSSLPNIPFRIHKTTRTLPLSSPAVINVHGTKWMDELKVMCNSAEAKLATSGKELSREPSKNADGLPGKLHEGDLYLCAESLEAMEGALGAVCEGVDAIFQSADDGPSRAFVVIRPPGHHCSSTYPSGFCWLNNVHVGIQHAILHHGLTHAAIIDFDLHHGDGSQSIAWDHNKRASTATKNSAAWKKTSIGYFSLHDINSYPCEQGDDEKVQNASLCIENAHGQNIWNVHLQPWKNEEGFWNIYETKYSVLLEKARSFLREQTQSRSSSSAPPKAAIFFSAGFDASEWESDGMQRHKVNVPTEFYARLSRDVVKLAAEEGLGVDGRIVSVLEGGYSDRALMTGVLSHISGLAGKDPLVKDGAGLGHEMSRRLGSIDGKTSENGFQIDSTPYDADWWSRPRLEQLDLALNSLATREPHEPFHHTKLHALGNFSSPTQSFIAKVVPQRKTSYGPSVTIEAAPRARAPSPTPPDVDWAVAAHELSKLLVPSDRQVTSCKPEELSAAATRDRRDRQSNLAENVETLPQAMGPPRPTTRMALRERKAPKSYVDDDDESAARPAAKAGRRKSVAGAAAFIAAYEPVNPVPSQPDFKQPATHSGRRKSTLSDISSASVASGMIPAVQLNGYPRPDYAQSIRPESSMSMRGPACEMRKPARPETIKLSRAPSRAQTRAPSRAPPRSRKTPTLNSGISNADGSHEVPPVRTMPLSQAGGVGEQPKTVDSSIDNITSGLGRVKLTLVTKAQREAKEQAARTSAKAPQKSAALKATRTPPANLKPNTPQPATPTKAGELPPTPAGTPVLAKPTLPTEEPAQPNEALSGNRLLTQPIEVLPAQQAAQLLQALNNPLHSDPLTETPSIPHAQPELSGGNSTPIPYQPGIPAPEPLTQPEIQTRPALNTNSPTAIKGTKKHELPVFSSTGPILFGGPIAQVTRDTDNHALIKNEKSDEQAEPKPIEQNGVSLGNSGDA